MKVCFGLSWRLLVSVLLVCHNLGVIGVSTACPARCQGSSRNGAGAMARFPGAKCEDAGECDGGTIFDFSVGLTNCCANLSIQLHVKRQFLISTYFTNPVSRGWVGFAIDQKASAMSSPSNWKLFWDEVVIHVPEPLSDLKRLWQSGQHVFAHRAGFKQYNKVDGILQDTYRSPNSGGCLITNGKPCPHDFQQDWVVEHVDDDGVGEVTVTISRPADTGDHFDTAVGGGPAVVAWGMGAWGDGSNRPGPFARKSCSCPQGAKYKWRPNSCAPDAKIPKVNPLSGAVGPTIGWGAMQGHAIVDLGACPASPPRPASTLPRAADSWNQPSVGPVLDGFGAAADDASILQCSACDRVIEDIPEWDCRHGWPSGPTLLKDLRPGERVCIPAHGAVDHPARGFCKCHPYSPKAQQVPGCPKCFKGDAACPAPYKYIGPIQLDIRGASGTPSNPVTITNCNGTARIGGWLEVRNSHHVVIAGTAPGALQIDRVAIRSNITGITIENVTLTGTVIESVKQKGFRSAIRTHACNDYDTKACGKCGTGPNQLPVLATVTLRRSYVLYHRMGWVTAMSAGSDGRGGPNGPPNSGCKAKFVLEDNIFAFTSAMSVHVEDMDGMMIIRRNLFLANSGAPMYTSTLRLGGKDHEDGPHYDRRLMKFIVDQNVFMDSTAVDCQCCDLLATNNVFMRNSVTDPVLSVRNKPAQGTPRCPSVVFAQNTVHSVSERRVIHTDLDCSPEDCAAKRCQRREREKICTEACSECWQNLVIANNVYTGFANTSAHQPSNCILAWRGFDGIPWSSKEWTHSSNVCLGSAAGLLENVKGLFDYTLPEYCFRAKPTSRSLTCKPMPFPGMFAAPPPWIQLGPTGRFLTGDMTKHFPYHQPAWPVDGGAASCTALKANKVANAPALSGDWKRAEVERLLARDLIGQARTGTCRDLGAVQRCRSGYCPPNSAVDPASTISFKKADVVSSCGTTVTTSTTPIRAGLLSGDIIFLKTRSGNGKHIDIEGTAVQSRWESQGNWQAIIIEKEGGGSIRTGDAVFFRVHTGAYIDVTERTSQARWNDRGAWQAITIEKKHPGGAILPDDLVCLKSQHTGKFLDVEDKVVRARWHDCGDWQTMKIQKEVVGAIFSGDPVHFVAHTGKLVEVEGSHVQARWSEHGVWQHFRIWSSAGRVIFSGDEVFLQAHTGKMLDVQGTNVQARWNDRGAWQRFIIEKEDGDGAVFPGDRIFLLAHTGNRLEVDGDNVQARSSGRGHRQGLLIEKSSMRRLTGIAMEATKVGYPFGWLSNVICFLLVGLLAAVFTATCYMHFAKTLEHDCLYKVEPSSELF